MPRRQLLPVHYTFHARGLLAPLADDACARWLWDRLRDAFADALGATLMPDHGHLIALAGHLRRLACILGAFARRFGFGELWLPVEEGLPLESPDKVSRVVRYGSLNPCRPTKLRGRVVTLVDDPLEWQWSTHRDVVGAAVEPWVTAERLADALGRGNADFVRTFHCYVSSDPHVRVNGTPLPTGAPASLARSGSLADVVSATLAATRGSVDELRRRGTVRTVVVGLAYRQGWRDAELLARLCDTHPNSIPRLAKHCPPSWLHAAALCLGDVRLRHSWRSGDVSRSPSWPSEPSPDRA
jgi:hypothetical protein